MLLATLGPGSLMLAAIAWTTSAGALQRHDRSLDELMQGSRIKVSDESGLLRTQLRRLPGKALAEGSNDQPVGLYRVTKYRVDEITPLAPIPAEADGKSLSLDRAWRVTIFGGPFIIRDAPALIWIDDQPVGFGAESPDLKSISTVIFDRSILRSGASLALSYGMEDRHRTVLPDRIDMGGTR
jgi:hypothetical protein